MTTKEYKAAADALHRHLHGRPHVLRVFPAREWGRNVIAVHVDNLTEFQKLALVGAVHGGVPVVVKEKK
jgi:hypothetical protein